MELEKNGAVLWRFMEGHKKGPYQPCMEISMPLGGETARKRISRGSVSFAFQKSDFSAKIQITYSDIFGHEKNNSLL